jgi:hypothetical protein
MALQRMIGNQAMMRQAQSITSVPVETPQTAAPAADGLAAQAPSTERIMRTPAEPYVSQINVNLTSPQRVTLDWQGTPPDGARSSFRCSTGKGYGDPGDPAGICLRSCCTAGSNPCASPNDRRSANGSCCTPVGSFVIQSKERDHAVDGGTIPFWMYFYRSRGIAIHEYNPVNGEPLSHGCVRLDSVNRPAQALPAPPRPRTPRPGPAHRKNSWPARKPRVRRSTVAHDERRHPTAGCAHRRGVAEMKQVRDA